MLFKPAKDNDKAILSALNRSQAVLEFTPDGIVLAANSTKTIFAEIGSR